MHAKKYMNHDLGVSFIYDSGWIQENKSKIKNRNKNRNKNEYDVYFHDQTSSFGISKLSDHMNNFISRWLLNKSILCTVNVGENIIDEVKNNKHQIDGEDNCSIITEITNEQYHYITEYILVGHKDQYYLLSFTTRCISQLDPEINHENIKKVTSGFKFTY